MPLSVRMIAVIFCSRDRSGLAAAAISGIVLMAFSVIFHSFTFCFFFMSFISRRETYYMKLVSSFAIVEPTQLLQKRF